MLPLWFFLILMGVIFSLLYITRATEDTFVTMSRNQFRKLQYWFRGSGVKQP